MENNQIQPIHIVAQELSEKTIELATYILAYENVNQENKELKKENEELKALQELVNSNEQIKALVEKVKNER
jgi:hypothetical protein